MKKSLIAAVIISGATLGLNACATIVQGQDQQVNVATSPSKQARCELTDNVGQKYYVTTPGSVTVNRGDGPLKVRCQVPGMAGEQIVQETIEPWVIGNIPLAVIGIAVDAATGSYQKYPDNVTVSIVKR